MEWNCPVTKKWDRFKGARIVWDFFFGGGEGFTTVEHSWYYPEKITAVNRIVQLQHEINIISNNTTVINAWGDCCKGSL